MNGTVTDAQATSSTATDSATDNNAQGATEVTPASTQGAQAESTPPADELAEFKADVAKATGQEPQDSTADSEAETDVAEAKETDEPAKAEGEAKETDALSQQEKVSEKLTERPEWLKLTAIADKVGKEAGKEVRAVLRGMFKQQHDLTSQVEQAKPAIEVVQEMMQSVGGSDVGFSNMRNLIKSFDQDPANAVPMLETLLSDAKKRAGLVVSSPELLTEQQKLQEQLDSGLIDTQAAETRKQELLELQQARTLKEQQKLTAQQRDQRQAAEQQQAAVQEIQQAAQQWEKEKLANDPDYLPLKNLHTSRVMQLAEAKVAELGRMLNGKEAKALADDALKQIKSEVGQLIPKRKERQAISGGSGSSGNNRQQPATEFDEFKADVERATRRK